ncbi:MAG: ribonuclease HII [Acidimicrobiales bacterium]
MTPTLEFEERELRHGPVVGIDEVGRGALAGPVMVGAVVLDGLRDAPRGIADSKALSASQRERMVPLIEQWASAFAVGIASAHEIDEWGLRVALAVATDRALSQLTLAPRGALIDGPVNLLRTSPTMALGDVPPRVVWSELPVVTIVKGDQRCATISAAAIIAKVRRDALMRELHEEAPLFGWSTNKGYGSLEHRRSLARYGPTRWHRRSWALPELGSTIEG